MKKNNQLKHLLLVPLLLMGLCACGGSTEISLTSSVSEEELSSEEISFSKIDYPYPCDYRVDAKNPERGFVVLQISDPQIANGDETNLKLKVYKFIDTAVEQANPDMLFIAGDIVYGRYDTDGTMLKNLLDHIDSYNIPWCPVFGNHDNETPMGIDYQVNLITSYENSLFKRRSELSGNGNYSVGLFVNDEIVHTFYFLDTKGCAQIGGDKSNISPAAITSDQVQFVTDTQANAELYAGRPVKGFVGSHIMTSIFAAALAGRYHVNITNELLEIPENTNGDWGSIGEKFPREVDNNGDAFYAFQEAHIDGIFAGHCHKDNASIMYEDVRLTFGLKSSTYDFYDVDKLGATKITVHVNESFDVEHIYVKDV